MRQLDKKFTIVNSCEVVDGSSAALHNERRKIRNVMDLTFHHRTGILIYLGEELKIFHGSHFLQCESMTK